ncbi:hypothetical protein B0H10DRAFT_1947483 [Mycena sp. CBHHK59/15]|nr:hypothetical protein B0H10DRAFT_1947483 [Mycena sp. CBHHK59/15]
MSTYGQDAQGSCGTRGYSWRIMPAGAWPSTSRAAWVRLHPQTGVLHLGCIILRLLQSVDSSAVLSLPAPRHTRTNVGYSRDMHTRLLCVGPSRAWAASDARRIVANPSCIRILSPLASPRHTARSSGSTKLLRHIHSKGGTFRRMHGTLAPSPAHQPGKYRACEQRRNNVSGH